MECSASNHGTCDDLLPYGTSYFESREDYNVTTQFQSHDDTYFLPSSRYAKLYLETIYNGLISVKWHKCQKVASKEIQYINHRIIL